MLPPSLHVILLRHCRCQDCRHLLKGLRPNSLSGSQCGRGMLVAEESVEAWHYCAEYDGPQVSKDVWVWRR